MDKPCQACGGSGQVCHFLGVSRFLLTREECPECAGLGVQLPPGEEEAGPALGAPPPRAEEPEGNE